VAEALRELTIEPSTPRAQADATIEAAQQVRERRPGDFGVLGKLSFNGAFGDSRNFGGGFHFLQRRLQFLDERRKSARRGGASQRTN
jgi:hypothetical protein